MRTQIPGRFFLLFILCQLLPSLTQLENSASAQTTHQKIEFSIFKNGASCDKLVSSPQICFKTRDGYKYDLTTAGKAIELTFDRNDRRPADTLEFVKTAEGISDNYCFRVVMFKDKAGYDKHKHINKKLRPAIDDTWYLSGCDNRGQGIGCLKDPRTGRSGKLLPFAKNNGQARRYFPEVKAHYFPKSLDLERNQSERAVFVKIEANSKNDGGNCKGGKPVIISGDPKVLIKPN